MRVLSLFTGIGGLDLGLQRAGMTIVGQCEICPFCREVLHRHWPNVWRQSDVRALTGAVARANCGRIDLVCGGFPCQDVSDAGFRIGLSGRRSGLWSEFARIIREIEAAWVLIENVDGLRRRGLKDVLRDLAACGYDAEWRVLGACDVGAPHIRERIFILAHRPGERLVRDEVETPIAGASVLEKAERSAALRPAFDGGIGRSGKRLPHAGVLRMDDGLPNELDVRRVAALGNAVIPQLAELIGLELMGREA
jgi:DNA (cytosine-5)-methyltransferase 1